jgi:PAS domain S-box-containing protein
MAASFPSPNSPDNPSGTRGFPSSSKIPPGKLVGSAEPTPAFPSPSQSNPPAPVFVTSADSHVSAPSFAPYTARVPGRMPGDEFFKSAVISAGIPVAAMDPTGLINTWNLAAARLFGRSDAEMLGRPLETAIPSDYRPVASRAFQRTLQQRSVNSYEVEIVPVGGKHSLHIGVILSCVTDGRGEVRGVMAWMRDITNRKELESNLSRSRHMASLGTLAAGVAHQFNNIVGGMSTMVDFALTTEDPDAMLRALRMSAEAATRISYITQSLMACTAQDNCPGGPDQSDLTEELLRFADAIEPSLKQKGIELELDLQSQRIAAVPRARFGQMLQHLLRNAEEAILEQPKSAPRKIALRTMSQGETIMVDFTDTGAGIDAEQLAQIFDPFFTTKGVHVGGTGSNPGLGLTIVHGVVMDMGGHVWADSCVGRGTTIHIMIPVVA